MQTKNWALFIESDKVQWSFGLNTRKKRKELNDSIDYFSNEQNEFEKTTVNFIQSLQAIGRELYSEGVASIKLENPTKSFLAVNEIFIVNLSDQFFFIISDLQVTTKLIDLLEDIPFEVEQVICAVLVGQAAILYSTLVIDQDKFGFNIDDIYKSILRQIEIDKFHDLNDLVDRGRCSLSPLKMTELLLFHYLLRNFLEQHFLKMNSNAWAIMVDKNGTDIPLSYLPPKDPYLLGNFLGVIYSYVQGLFGVRPSAIVFGGTELIFLQFFSSGNNYFLAASNPKLLVRTQMFIDLLGKIPENKVQEVLISIKNFIIELTLLDLSQVLERTDFASLTKMLIENKKITITGYTLLDLPGIGKKTQKILNKYNIFTLKDLNEFDFKGNEHNDELLSIFNAKKIIKWKEEAIKLLSKNNGF
jgi:hypothetical protein